MIIGFEDTSYTVDEDNGQVSVNVVVIEGEVSGTVQIRIRTRDGTADCEGVHTSIYQIHSISQHRQKSEATNKLLGLFLATCCFRLQ